MSAWKVRVAELARKEARCPGCLKAKRLAEGTTLPQICEAHMRIRCDMALPQRKWSR